MEVYLIRHTTPQVAKGIAYGQTDLDVIETFDQEAQQIRALLPEAHQEEMYCFASPLQRCAKLAQHLFKPSQITFEPKLKEANYGDWEMKPWNDIDHQALNRWMSDFAKERIPNGETYEEVFERAVQVWEHIHQLPHEKVALVTHFGIIQSLLAHLLHIPLDKTFRIHLDYGCVIQVSVNLPMLKVRFLK
ncbi:MAG TPA: alpha-ribazole phosphatase [Microscillaceae bacterium]|jgi:alpha-ribazole phosphatase|nr:alpha-ribazole phosphatase [Microscillaceae bacterium]